MGSSRNIGDAFAIPDLYQSSTFAHFSYEEGPGLEDLNAFGGLPCMWVGLPTATNTFGQMQSRARIRRA